MSGDELLYAEIVHGLSVHGKTLVIVRKDDPAAKIVAELMRDGLVTTELHQIDEQSSELRVRWAR